MTRPSVLPSAETTASAPGIGSFAAQYLACALPYRRFVPALADNDARLGVDVDRYSFIAVDLHHLLLAGLPAHAKRYPGQRFHAEGIPDVASLIRATRS